jgi:predicted N-formylglutamate amidohydrolase
MNMPTVIISCEHAVNHIPKAYRHLFTNATNALESHLAFDYGAHEVAQQWSQTLQCPLVEASVSRLLIDHNRSLHHRHCFSAYSKSLIQADRQSIIDQYYKPYRQKVETLIAEKMQQGIPVIHLSIHSFTPIWNGILRNADIGLLYDSRRKHEKSLAQALQIDITKSSPYKVRMNYPYRGMSDGFVSALRKTYTEPDYLGFEIEMNDAGLRDKPCRIALTNCLIESFQTITKSRYSLGLTQNIVHE